jgi:hypothetical protein
LWYISTVVENIGSFINEHWLEPEIKSPNGYDPAQHYAAILKRQGHDKVPSNLDAGDVSNFYRTSVDDGKKKMRGHQYDMRRQMLENNLDEIIERDILRPHAGIMEVGPYNEFWSETVELYVYGHHYACIAFGGFRLERICQDLIRFHDIVRNGQKLSLEQKEQLYINKDKTLYDLINIVKKAGIINKGIQNKMHEIRDTIHDDISIAA